MVSSELFAYIDELTTSISPQVACQLEELKALVERAIVDDCIDILDGKTGRVCRFSSLPGNRKSTLGRSSGKTDSDFDLFEVGCGWNALESNGRSVVCPPQIGRPWTHFSRQATSCEGGGEGRYKVSARQIVELLDRFGLRATLPVQESTEQTRNPRGAGAKPFPHKDECTDALFFRLMSEGDDEHEPDSRYEGFVCGWYEDRGQRPPEKTTARQIIQGARKRWQRQDGPKALPVIRR